MILSNFKQKFISNTKAVQRLKKKNMEHLQAEITKQKNDFKFKLASKTIKFNEQKNDFESQLANKNNLV